MYRWKSDERAKLAATGLTSYDSNSCRVKVSPPTRAKMVTGLRGWFGNSNKADGTDGDGNYCNDVEHPRPASELDEDCADDKAKHYVAEGKLTVPHSYSASHRSRGTHIHQTKRLRLSKAGQYRRKAQENATYALAPQVQETCSPTK